MPPFDLERWQHLSPHIDRALDLPTIERRAWLSNMRAQDPALADELQKLLAEHRALDQEGFLDDAPPSGDTAGEAEARPLSFGKATLAGQQIGPYTLVSHIGEGGMGTVWLARRSDGRFEGNVAIKLLNASLFGHAYEQRFRHEGTVLARLTHPSIAHLIDAGVSRIGQPYLVLEYVQGVHIDRYCNSHRLDVKARVRLFLEVLAAIAHAHANLVVHRDIKPSNVLVRTDEADGTPVAKLLDFGIAKLLEVDEDAGTALLTRDSGWALTPEFAAPEQLTGGAVTTATDVYALGLLLYQLLGGRHPVAHAAKSPARLIELVVNADAPRLSTSLKPTKANSREELAAMAAERSTTPERLQRIVKGDLDTILAKALKRDPRERYASVTAFADDLRRYLEQRPISARPDTLRYRATTFVRRNRVPVALAAAALAALVTGVLGTISQAQRATQQAAIAESQRQRAEVQRQRADQEARMVGVQRDFALRQLSRVQALNDLNEFLLSQTVPSAKKFTAVDLLARAEETVEKQQENDENHVEMMISLGNQYSQIEENDRAYDILSRAYVLSRPLADQTTRARAACSLAPAVSRAGDPERAERLVEEGLKALPDEPQYALNRVYCYMYGSDVAVSNSNPDIIIQRSLAARDTLRRSGLSTPMLELRVRRGLARAYVASGRLAESVPLFAEIAGQLEAMGRADTHMANVNYSNWGHTLYLLGRAVEAEPLLRRAIHTIGDDAYGRRGTIPLNYARVLLELHRFSDAHKYAATARAMATRSHNTIWMRMSSLVEAAAARELGRFDEADRLLTEIEAIPANDDTGLLKVSAASERSLLALARGDTAGALALADRLVAMFAGAEHVPMTRVLIRNSQIALRAGRLDRAEADARQALVWEREELPDGAVGYNLGRAHLALGQALHAKGRNDEARAALIDAVAALTPTLGASHPETRLAERLLAALHEPRVSVHHQ